MKKFIIATAAIGLGIYAYLKSKQTADTTGTSHLLVKHRPSLRKTVDDSGRVTFEVDNPNTGDVGIDYSPIAYYGADLCIDPEIVGGTFHSLQFPTMVLEGHEVYVSVLAEYQDGSEFGIDQICSMNLSKESEAHIFTHETLDEFVNERFEGEYPYNLSVRFHAKQRGNYAMTYKKVDYDYPLVIKFDGDANTRLVLSIWSRLDVDEASDTYETVYHVNND